MRPVEFDSFAVDVELVLKHLLTQFHLKAIFKDKSSFYCQNNFSKIWIYYEGSSLQFMIIDSKDNQRHIYDFLRMRGLSQLVPITVEPGCLERFKKEFNYTYEFYVSDLCWLNEIGKILIQNCQDVFTH